MRKVIFPLMLLVSISCMQNEIEPESQLQGDQVTNTPHIVQYDNEKSTMDSLSRVSKMQSDHDVLMMNSISYSHGKYLLCLTVEDALMMGIPDVTYAKYAAIVSKHNNK